MNPRRLGLAMVFGILVVSVVVGCVGIHDVPHSMRGWNDPVAPFRIAGNIHYVGTNEMALFLITTPAGHVLLDSGFEANLTNLRANVEALGFHFGDIKILLASHAHIDHVQAHAQVRALTGARVVASAADAPVIASGGRGEWAYGDAYAWPPCPVDQIIGDGEAISLGGTTLVAHLTPGHSKGATTWTMRIDEGGRPLDVVFYASGNVPPGKRLIDDPTYPQAVEDFQRSFATWRALPCDLFLGAHATFFDLARKRRAQQAGAQPNPFIDPEGYRRTIAAAETKFHALTGR